MRRSPNREATTVDRGQQTVSTPTSTTTRRTAGGDLFGRYLRLWDPLVALSFVAARTDLVVGTCVALHGEHDQATHGRNGTALPARLVRSCPTG